MKGDGVIFCPDCRTSLRYEILEKDGKILLTLMPSTISHVDNAKLSDFMPHDSAASAVSNNP